MLQHWINRTGSAICYLLLLSGLAACGGSLPRAEVTPNAVAAQYPAAVTSRYARALGYMDAGDDEHAVQEFEHVIEGYPEYAGPYINLGIIHQRNSRPDAAMLALQRAITVCSDCAAAYNQLGIVQRERGEFAAAEKSYLAAIAADSGYALAYFNLGVLYDLYQDRPDLALQYYESFTERRRPEAVENKDVVDKWIIDLRRRTGEPQRAASMSPVEGAQ